MSRPVYCHRSIIPSSPRSPKFYLDKLPRCDYEVEHFLCTIPNAMHSEIESCGEPAVYLASWGYLETRSSDEAGDHPPEAIRETMYLCEEHADIVEAAEWEKMEEAEEESGSNTEQDA